MSLSLLLLLSVVFVRSFASTAGLFDLSEYRSVSYEASIGDDFLWFAPGLKLKEVTTENIDDFEKRIVAEIPDESVENYLFVTSKGGQKFACPLPDINLTKDSPKTSKNPKIYSDALAASFYVNKCIKLRGNHWWSYILCRGQTVEQVHGEPGTEGYVKNILGLFDGNLQMPPFHESTDDRLLYVEESYTSGTFCDLEDFREPRSTTVRYECDAQLSTNEAYVQSVVEVRPCQYLMTVRVGTLCHYPEFLPASQANSKKVECKPYLNKMQIRSLLEQQIEVAKKKADTEEELSLAKQKFRRTAERYAALTKAQRNLNIPDVKKKISAEMDYRAAHLDFVVASLKATGAKMSKSRLNSIYKLLDSADMQDFLLNIDYDSVEEENRGHLWYYFHDSTWPKDQFPKDIFLTAIQNAYAEEVQKSLRGTYVFSANSDYVDSLTNFIKTGDVDINFNLVIPATDIYYDISEFALSKLNGKREWLRNLYGTFLEDIHIVDGVIEKLMKPRKADAGLPLGTLASKSIHFLYSELEDEMSQILTQGRISSSDTNPDDDVIEFDIYKTLRITKIDQESKKATVGYKVEVPDEAETFEQLEAFYEKVLTPLYQLLSIRWFQVQTPKYFHVNPPSNEHLEESDSDDYKFHKNLVVDLKLFSRMLAEGTLEKMKKMMTSQTPEANRDYSTQAFLKHWSSMSDEVLGDILEEDNHSVVAELFDNLGMIPVQEARKRLWKNKVEKYKTHFWIKDYRLRKEARSVHGLMADLLSKDYSDVRFSVGGKSSSTRSMGGEEELMRKLKNVLISLEDSDDPLKGSSSGHDDEFYEMSEIENMMDMLERAGLSKDVDVQIKMLDADGNEVATDVLNEAAKILLDEVESISRFRKTEKAYLSNYMKTSNEEDEEEKEED